MLMDDRNLNGLSMFAPRIMRAVGGMLEEMLIINTMGIGDGGLVAIVTMMTVIRIDVRNIGALMAMATSGGLRQIVR